MTVLVTISATLAAVLHVLIFYMESIAWQKPSVWKRFGLSTQEEADTTAKLAYNQGFYNLFLAVGAIIGAILYGTGMTEAGFVLAIFSVSCMLAASIVLVISGKKYIRAAITQGLFPLITVVLLLLSVSGLGN
ncbi:DUF1304 domain-containing protein [Lysinibacter cavernae]|uniref:Putative membrane protein n=1 Tax=Lysinibacter cavernae TaxID=1640652 RepID=A0A7X5R0W9_9MICO|nr:DUF1304 domain-containing protein [Lysinibacter cavernae]NIH53566.1 putative membrane protein [Lysinibacter cavernae]